MDSHDCQSWEKYPPIILCPPFLAEIRTRDPDPDQNVTIDALDHSANDPFYMIPKRSSFTKCKSIFAPNCPFNWNGRLNFSELFGKSFFFFFWKSFFFFFWKSWKKLKHLQLWFLLMHWGTFIELDSVLQSFGCQNVLTCSFEISTKSFSKQSF